MQQRNRLREFMLGHEVMLYGGFTETKRILLHFKTSFQNELFSKNSTL
jgi:hypothetical protein